MKILDIFREQLSAGLRLSERLLLLQIFGKYSSVRNILFVIVFLYSAAFPSDVYSASTAMVPEQGYSGQLPFISDALVADLNSGSAREVLILFDDSALRQEARQVGRNPKERLTERFNRYKVLKKDFLTKLPASQATLIRDFSHLPLCFARVHGPAGLSQLRSRPDILAIYENRHFTFTLSESLPYIEQPPVAEAGFSGAGVTVAVVDSGVNYTRTEFGSCSSPGNPESCRILASIDIAADDGQLDDNGHGTIVSAIIAGVAPATSLAVLDIFDGSNSSSALLLDAINWVLANHSTYNIRTINLSLGDGSQNSSPCNSRWYNPFLSPINDLRDIGVTVVASSGNDGYTNGIGMPACTPGVISVGAVYDADIGSRSWTSCSDSSTAADQVTCFSNSAYYLSILAPGALITAGGYIASGTSQAAPHVAAATAVLASAEPFFSPDDIADRLLATGTPTLDSRNGLVFPRLNLLAALKVEIEANATIEQQVPLLSPWALLILGVMLVLTGIRKRSRSPRTDSRGIGTRSSTFAGDSC